jgi:L-arabinose transport system substrate-binding protein
MRLFKAAMLAGTVAIILRVPHSQQTSRSASSSSSRKSRGSRTNGSSPTIAAKEKGFTVVKIGAEDGEKVQSAIDNLGAQGAQGFIICTPDVKLGPGIVAKAAANQLKLMTVDDRLVGADGKPLEDVPHMGISATKDRRNCRPGLR